jgi:galactokinase
MPGVASLRDVAFKDFRAIESSLSEPERKRCRHVITENARTVEAAHALRDRDLEKLGSLMWSSHESLKLDYEVSCHELDVLVDAAHGIGDDVVGARMTGGGFGGCTINVVKREAVDRFSLSVRRIYEEEIGLLPNIFEVFASNGASEILG